MIIGVGNCYLCMMMGKHCMLTVGTRKYSIAKFIMVAVSSNAVLRLISRVGSISKWPLQSIYYSLHAYISRKQVHFAYIKTYQVFLSIASSIEIVSTCSSITGVRNHSMFKTQNLSSSFFLPFFLSKNIILQYLHHTTSCPQAVLFILGCHRW